MAWLPDETSPRRPVPLDPEAGQVVAVQAGVSEPVENNGGYAVLPDWIRPNAGTVAWADGFSQGPWASYLDNAPATKEADSTVGLDGPQIDPGPVAGDENYIHQLMNGLAATQAVGPLQSASSNPPTSQIVANAASMPGSSIMGDEASAMAILNGAA